MSSFDRNSKYQYEGTFDLVQFPICDNCGKQMSMFGKYLKRNGKFIYVHTTYDEVTQMCETDAI